MEPRNSLRLLDVLLAFMLCQCLLLGAPAKENRPSLVSMEGKKVDPFSAEHRLSRFLAFAFVCTDCPISNAYAPELRRLQREFASDGVEFRLVYGGDESPGTIRDHLREYSYPIAAFRDPRSAFAARSRVRVTPEVAVYTPGGELLYHGRIDDRYAALGKKRPAPTTRDLRSALESLIAGKPAKPAAGPAVGCFIEGPR